MPGLTGDGRMACDAMRRPTFHAPLGEPVPKIDIEMEIGAIVGFASAANESERNILNA